MVLCALITFLLLPATLSGQADSRLDRLKDEALEMVEGECN